MHNGDKEGVKRVENELKAEIETKLLKAILKEKKPAEIGWAIDNYREFVLALSVPKEDK